MRRFGFGVTVLILSAGCRDSVSIATADAAPTSSRVSTKFDPTTAGTITGRVRWSGPAPTVPPIEVERLHQIAGKVEHLQRPNPHAPQIDPKTNGVGGLVIFLRGVDSEYARPWDHPPVSIEMNDERPIVHQDAPNGLIGFVRRGETVTLVSKQNEPHAVRARGAAFFTLTLPEPEKPRRRLMNEVGHVEVSSANGNIAMRAHLFVDDHPYYTLTDHEGKFQLPKVPPGTYDVVCWRPDWRIERRERDPETLVYVRLFFLPPKEASVPVTVRPSDAATVMMEVGAE
jgi:hypothetical protein